MTEVFGGQTVACVTFADTGTRDSLGMDPQQETATNVPGCRHRPLTFSETAEYDVDVSTEVWKTTAPPVAAILALESDSVIRVDGVTFHVIAGPKHYVDMDGAPFKVTVLSKRQVS